MLCVRVLACVWGGIIGVAGPYIMGACAYRPSRTTEKPSEKGGKGGKGEQGDKGGRAWCGVGCCV